MYKEEDYLQLSGIQHFKFCRRQWALIHIENQWQENVLTVEGHIMHERAHDNSVREKRGNIIITRGVRIFSARLGITGMCDVVEFREDKAGITIQSEKGLYIPFPIEYKRGSARVDLANELQLCAEAMCLEEMLCCDIPSGALYYGETHHREKILFTDELRKDVETTVLQMHELYDRGHTPKVKPTKSCNACSLKDVCMPEVLRRRSVDAYMIQQMVDEK